MSAVLDLNRRDLLRLGAGVFGELERGAIVYVRALDEIAVLVDEIVRLMGDRVSPEAAASVQAFLDGGPRPALPVLHELLLLLRDLRDSRTLSCLFSDLIAGLGLPSPVLIDTGHFRCVLPGDGPALAADPRLAVDRSGRMLNGPEPMIQGSIGSGNPHRDLDTPHSTFQVNFWFTLHDVAADSSLLLFPEAYRKDLAYQQKPTDTQNPASWGYGEPICRALSRGDAVLFHSQHFHASPPRAPANNSRLTVELRASSACHDDNGALYRRLFWNAHNFAGLPGAPEAPSRARRLYPATGRGDVLTAQELFASLFENPEAARRAGNLWTQDTVFAGSRRLDDKAAAELAHRLIECPFAEDRQLALARYLLFHGQRALAELVLADVAQRTESYYFALETARIAGGQHLWNVAGAALLRAVPLAQASPVRLGRYGEVPSRPIPRLQFLPEDALRAVPTLIGALREHLLAPATTPAPLLDFRVFYPYFMVGKPLPPRGAVIGVWSLALFIPDARLEAVGLRYPSGNDENMEGTLDPAALVKDSTGILLAYSGPELQDMLRAATEKAASRT